MVIENYLQSKQYRKKLLFEHQLLEERVQAARADVEHTNLMHGHGSSLTSDSGGSVVSHVVTPAFFLAAQRIS